MTSRFPNQKGFTLTEILIVTVVLGVIFLGVTSLQVSSLSMLRAQMNAPDVNAVMAFEQIIRDAKEATDVAVTDAAGTAVGVGVGGTQLKLNFDTGNPPNASLADDQWVVYGFIGGRLRWKTPFAATGRAIAAPNITAADPEVVPGLVVLGTSQFSPTNPSGAGAATFINIDLAIQGVSRTLSSSVLPQRSK